MSKSKSKPQNANQQQHDPAIAEFNNQPQPKHDPAIAEFNKHLQADLKLTHYSAKKIEPAPIEWIDMTTGLPSSNDDKEEIKDLHLLWPEESKFWFTCSDNELDNQIADNVEELYEDPRYKDRCRKQINTFYKAKVNYDERKALGKYVKQNPWPFEPDNPREFNLPDDLPALYVILARFHDWMPGRELITSDTDAWSIYEFNMQRYSFSEQQRKASWGYLKQRPIDLDEIQTFFEHVKKDLKTYFASQQKKYLQKRKKAEKKLKLLPINTPVKIEEAGNGQKLEHEITINDDKLSHSCSKKTKKQRGRKPLSKQDFEKYQMIIKDWKEAHDASISRKDFCEDKNITIEYLETCQACIRQREARSN